jgi:hypothetical protein
MNGFAERSVSTRHTQDPVALAVTTGDLNVRHAGPGRGEVPVHDEDLSVGATATETVLGAPAWLTAPV